MTSPQPGSSARGAIADPPASNIPDFQGRPLPHPDEPIFDQGLLFDVGTLTRRRVLQALGFGAVSAGMFTIMGCQPSGSGATARASAGAGATAGSGVENESFLRGVQAAGSDGVASFTSVFPGCYAGRWPHIHFEVYPDVASAADAAKVIATSQIAMPEDICKQVYGQSGYEASFSNLAGTSLSRDNVFGNDGGVHQLGTMSGSIGNGLTVHLQVPVQA